jgi:hypothetical protein
VNDSIDFEVGNTLDLSLSLAIYQLFVDKLITLCYSFFKCKIRKVEYLLLLPMVVLKIH